jgi:hypothetical protein
VTLVALHQPTFLPYLGWWDKLARADVLVLLDDVPFPKKGGTWMNRVRILVNGSPTWLTVPVDRSYHGLRSVREMLVDDSTPWRDKAVRTLATSYARADRSDEVVPIVAQIVEAETTRLAELTEHGIRLLASQLSLDTRKLVRQSQLPPVARQGTDLLIALTKAVGGDAYLNGDGSAEYLEPHKFAAAGLELVQQEFVHPRYPQQSDEFVPGLSVVDAASNCGWDGTRALLTSS